jgi:4-carboxymuconolactone decarboxylase
MTNLFEKGRATKEKVLGVCNDTEAAPSPGSVEQMLDHFETEFMWGLVWSRPGLDLRTRCLLNIAMVIALNRPRELPRQIKAARRNGCSHDEILEVLLQANTMCGGPAANEAFHIAHAVAAEEDA